MKHDFIDENAREQLSALLDGELDNDDSARFLQRRLQHDDALVGQLVRWQLAGDVLRANARSGGGDDLASRVRAAIEREQAPVATKAQPRRGWMLWGGGLAAAAALGFAVLNLPGAADTVAVPAAREVATVPNTPIATASAITASVEVPAKQSPAVVAVSGSAKHRIAEAVPRHRQREEAVDVSRRVHRDAEEASPVAGVREMTTAVAASATDKAKAKRNPFTMQAAAPQAELPWPKSVLPGFNSGLNADFRSDGSTGNPFAPRHAYEEKTTP